MPLPQPKNEAAQITEGQGFIPCSEKSVFQTISPLFSGDETALALPRVIVMRKD
jgi:hypothetical protein